MGQSLHYREQSVQTACLLIVAAVSLGFGLYWLRPVMIPFMLALVITYALAPLLEFLKRYLKAPHAVIVGFAFCIVLILLFALSLVLRMSVNELTIDAGSYQYQVNRLIIRFYNSLPVDAMGLESVESFLPFQGLQNGTITSVATYVMNALFNLLSEGLLVLIMVFFLLIGQKGTPRRQPGTWGEVEAHIKRYLSTKFVLSAVTGVLVWVCLEILQVKLSIVFGLFAFLLNFIPNIGSVIATVLPIPVVMLSSDVSTTVAVLAIAIPGVLQFVMGNILEPKIMGDTLDLHPVVVLMALIFWGTLWGFVGMLLATPITAAVKIWLDRSDFTRPAGELLAGRLPEHGDPMPSEDVEAESTEDTLS